MLAGVTEGENTYSYTYDENGIRTSKTVNGVKTLYNTYGGMVLSQSDGTNTMYFQYNSSGKPVGFVYNGTQYYYITNALGDIVALTDANGNVFAEYIYNEWGEVLSIMLIDESYSDIANANPLRYRGYYYDNETGYYYLQSRYYDTQICRFINADSFNFINASSRISTNAYAYCENDPINYVDPTGCLFAEIAAGLATVATYMLVYFVFVIIVIALMPMIGEISSLDFGELALPSISVPSVSIPTSAAQADAEIRDKIKNNDDNYYWEATRIFNYVVIGKELSYIEATERVHSNKDVFAVSKHAAYSLAKSASGGIEPVGPEIDKGKEGVLGYYYHYHTYNRIYESHIFYIL